MSETDTEQAAEPQPAEPERPGARALREALERAQQRAAVAQERAAQVEPLEAQNLALRRLLGLSRAGIDPHGPLGVGIVATAAANGIDDPDDVAALAAVMVAEARGDLPTTNGQRSEDASD